MSKWRGFLEESKSYMNHPDHWKEWDVAADWYPDGWTMGDMRRAKLRFWLAYPRAWLRFHFSIVRGWALDSRRRILHDIGNQA